MNRFFVYTLFSAFLFTSLSWASDQELSDSEMTTEVSQSAGQIMVHRVRPQTADPLELLRRMREQSATSRPGVDDARAEVREVLSELKDLGASVKREYDAVSRECIKLDSSYEAIPSAFSGIPGGMFVNPGFAHPLLNDWCAISLPDDTLMKFDPARWIQSLSHHRKSNNNSYLNIESYDVQTLANSVYVGARHCGGNGHYDAAGHNYVGNSGCCAYYTLSAKEQLLRLAVAALKHNKEHQDFVRAVNKFDTQTRALHANYLALSSSYPAVFAVQAYPVQPVDSYTAFPSFNSWLVQMSPNNSGGVMAGFTESDDPSLMAWHMYVQSRYATCGHGTGNDYQTTSWCCAGYARSIKVDMFQMARTLVANQRNHDNYVAASRQFESNVKAILNSYWQALRGWNGQHVIVNGTQVSLAGTTIVGQQQSASDHYQRIRENRSAVKGHLDNTLKTLSTVDDKCTKVASVISSKLERALDGSRTSQGGGEAEIVLLQTTLEKNTELKKKTRELEENIKRLNTALVAMQEKEVEHKIDEAVASGTQDLTKQLEEMRKQLSANTDGQRLKELEDKMVKREKELQDEIEKTKKELTDSMAKREKELRDDIARISSIAEADREGAAEILGEILFVLGGEKDPGLVETFNKRPVREMARLSRFNILVPIRRLTAMLPPQ